MEIRKAKVNDDENKVAELMYSSGPEIYDFMHQIRGTDAKAYISYEFKTGRGFCGYKNVTVAVDKNSIIGVGCLFDGKTYDKLLLQTLTNMMKYYGVVKFWSALKRAGYSSSLIKKPRKDELYLSNFAVQEGMRGTGIGSTMMKNRMEKAKKEGYQTFSLDVAVNNPRAEKLYTKLGLEVKEEKSFKGKRKGISVPNVKKMELAIQ